MKKRINICLITLFVLISGKSFGLINPLNSDINDKITLNQFNCKQNFNELLHQNSENDNRRYKNLYYGMTLKLFILNLEWVNYNTYFNEFALYGDLFWFPNGNKKYYRLSAGLAVSEGDQGYLYISPYYLGAGAHYFMLGDKDTFIRMPIGFTLSMMRLNASPGLYHDLLAGVEFGLELGRFRMMMSLNFIFLRTYDHSLDMGIGLRF